MRFDEVEKILGNWNVALVSRDAARVRGHDLNTYRSLAKQTEHIDYDCSSGDYFCRYEEIGDRGCCAECASTFGHWRKESGALDELSAKTMAEHYDPEDGFWRADVGCLLPRALRSPTCLYTICSDLKMSVEDKDLLSRIRNGLTTNMK